MTAALRVTTGQLEGRVLLLPEERSLSLGSSLERDLILSGLKVAKSHARLSPIPSGHRLSGLGEARIAVPDGQVAELELRDGESFAIAGHSFVYHAELESEGAIEVCLCCGADADGLGPCCRRCVDRRLLVSCRVQELEILRKVQMSDLDVTYLAWDAQEDRRYSLRLFKSEYQNEPKLVKRFLARSLVGLGLSHPGFAQVYSIGSLHGGGYALRELVEDSLKLERFLRAQAPLSAKVSVKLTHSLIDIVAYARAHGVLVGRRRPSGIYVQRDGALKVADFDLSNELFASIVETGVFDDFRAQHFAPSEPHGFGENHDKLDHLERESEDCFDVFPEASDLLWLGRMFFQMLSGQDYHFESAHRLIVEGYGRANEEGVLCREGALKGCPRDVLVVLARMMSSEAGKRFKTLAEARAVLEAMLKSPFWAAEG